MLHVKHLLVCSKCEVLRLLDGLKVNMVAVHLQFNVTLTVNDGIFEL